MGIGKGSVVPEDSSMHPLGFVELVTEHKLIGAIIALAVGVFLVSITKLVIILYQERKKAAQHDDNAST